MQKTQDPEERALTVLVDAKTLALSALNELGTLYTARGHDVVGVANAIELEQSTLAGYQLALDNHKKHSSWKRGRK